MSPSKKRSANYAPLTQHTQQKNYTKDQTEKPASLQAFTIDHLDSLAQGVSKTGQTITFVDKTLPGEHCNAYIYKTKKNLQFARLQSIDKPAANRISPECIHYAQCPGCHYLHTDYASEINYKHAALQQHLKHGALANTPITLVEAPQRFAYRNRIQLHYEKERLGFIDSSDNTLVEVPNCRIIRPELSDTLKRLYQNRDFPKPLKSRATNKRSKKQPKGHYEIYLKGEKVELHWNQAYSAGGFTQVNETLNQELLNTIFLLCKDKLHKNVLDLFSGSGNLSQSLADELSITRTMVDSYHINDQNFITLDLHAPDALQNFLAANQYKKNRPKHYDLLIVDPPRKGFELLHLWLKKFKPKQLIYVSCYPQSLARDLQLISGKYEDIEIYLIDMFPGTKHFETLVSITFKKH